MRFRDRQGRELELITKPSANLQLTASLAHLEATYNNYPAARWAAPLFPTCRTKLARRRERVDLHRECCRQVSERLAALFRFRGRDYNLSINAAYALSLHGDYAYRTRAFFDPSNTLVQSQAGYGLLQCAYHSLLPTASFWQVELWARIGDKRYLTTTAASGVVPDGYAGDPAHVWDSHVHELSVKRSMSNNSATCRVHVEQDSSKDSWSMASASSSVCHSPRPPVAELRWCAPVSMRGVERLRDAKRFGAACLQTVGAAFICGPRSQSEDCLYLNV